MSGSEPHPQPQSSTAQATPSSRGLVDLQTPQAPQSLDELLRSPHNPAHANGLPGSPPRDEHRWNGFHLWRTESEDASKARQRNTIQGNLEHAQRRSRWQRTLRAAAQKLRSIKSWGAFSIYREQPDVDFRSENLHADDDDDDEDPEQAEPRLTTFGLMALTISLAGAQLAWTLELAYGTPYLLSLGLKEQSTSLVWLAGPLSGLIAQPVIGSLSDKSTSKFRRRRFMVISALLVTVSTLVLAFSVPLSILLVDLFGGGLADWDPRRHELVRTATQWISVLAFWILDFALNGLQAASRALILDVAPSSQQSIANAWHGRMTHTGNVVGYLCGWFDLGGWKGLSWLGGGQFRRFAVVSLLGMLSCVIATVSAIEEKTPQPCASHPAPSVWQQLRGIVDNVWQTTRRLPRPVRRVCLVQLFAYMGWFPFLFYSTTFVLQIYDARANQLSHNKEDDAKAERGSFAMLMFAIVALVSGALLPTLSLARDRQSGGIALDTSDEQGDEALGAVEDLEERSVSELDATMRALHGRPSMTLGQRIRRGLKYGITLRTFWTMASVLFAVLMMATFFVDTVEQATVLIALVGLPWSVATWAPFAMVSEFVREAEQGRSPFEFDGDHWSPARTRARDKARRRSSLLRSGEFTRERRSLVESDAEHDAKSHLSAALTGCQPLRGSSQSPTKRRGSGLDTFVALDGELMAPSRPAQQDRTETGLTADTADAVWEGLRGGVADHAEEEEAKFGGTILGIHNLAIVAPQFVVAIISALIFSAAEKGKGRLGPILMAPEIVATLQSADGRPAEGVAWVLRFGGLMALFAAVATRFIPLTATERRKRGEHTLPHAERDPVLDGTPYEAEEPQRV
ncbi:hypothetical protein ACQY0O_001899 [Thecaphora frezii]